MKESRKPYDGLSQDYIFYVCVCVHYTFNVKFVEIACKVAREKDVKINYEMYRSCTVIYEFYKLRV